MVAWYLGISIDLIPVGRGIMKDITLSVFILAPQLYSVWSSELFEHLCNRALWAHRYPLHWISLNLTFLSEDINFHGSNFSAVISFHSTLSYEEIHFSGFHFFHCDFVAFNVILWWCSLWVALALTFSTVISLHSSQFYEETHFSGSDDSTGILLRSVFPPTRSPCLYSENSQIPFPRINQESIPIMITSLLAFIPSNVLCLTILSQLNIPIQKKYPAIFWWKNSTCPSGQKTITEKQQALDNRHISSVVFTNSSLKI